MIASVERSISTTVLNYGCSPRGAICYKLKSTGFTCRVFYEISINYHAITRLFFPY
jgi:hypothetical protein